MRGATRRSPALLAVGLAGALLAGRAVAAPPAPCAGARGTLYLTLDTGNMRHAELIAETLARRGVRATFFLANEPTFRGDHALDPAWGDYWRARVAEGHAFGSHTWRHGVFRRDQGEAVVYAPQFGLNAGRTERLDQGALCRELDRVAQAFRAMTERPLDPVWRAPGGRTTPRAVAWAAACGYRHVHWSPAGFLGDELPSDRFPNDALVGRALRGLRAGDVLMMHLGIWSRQEPFAPALASLLTGLEAQGFCFATVPGTRSPG